jgi:hypothetical protein
VPFFLSKTKSNAEKFPMFKQMLFGGEPGSSATMNIGLAVFWIFAGNAGGFARFMKTATANRPNV